MAGLHDNYLVLVGVLLAVAIVTRVAVPTRRSDVDINASTIAYLLGGARAAVVTALATLHARKVVAATRRGTVKKVGPLDGSKDPLERAVYAALHQPNGPRGLQTRPQVRRALAELCDGLVQAGLLLGTWQWVALRLALCAITLTGVARLFAGPLEPVIWTVLAGSVALAVVLWLPPRRTLAARRTLRALRHRHPPLAPPQPPGQPQWSPNEIGMAVALYGAPALRITMPNFARDGGLLDGGKRDETPGDGTIGPNSYSQGSGSSIP